MKKQKSEVDNSIAKLRQDFLARFSRGEILKLKQALENGASAAQIRAQFGVSIKEAKTLIDDVDPLRNSLLDQAQIRDLNKGRQERLEELVDPGPSLSDLDKDLKLRELRNVAQAKNAEDKKRLTKQQSQNSFRVEEDKLDLFKRHITKGLSHCESVYNVNKEQIILEIKRLLPKVDISLLRP